MIRYRRTPEGMKASTEHGYGRWTSTPHPYQAPPRRLFIAEFTAAAQEGERVTHRIFGDKHTVRKWLERQLSGE